MKKTDVLAAINAPRDESAAAVPPYASKSMMAADVQALAQLAPERDLEAVARAVRESIEKNEPAAGLDRLHTFCTALVRSLYEQRVVVTLARTVP